MHVHTKITGLADLFAVVSASASLAAWQEQLDWTLRIVASLIAIIAGGIAIYRYFRRTKVTPADPEI